jgi:mediator of RNA polymerase II transcription subunit 14
VAQTIVEQQLKDRSIPYSLKYPPATGETAEAGAAKSTSAVAGMIPTIEVDVHDLLRDRRASDVANPKVLIQLKDWWNGGKCKVSTVVQLRHKPALSSSGGTPNGSSGPTVKDEGISFDQASSTVRFSADDISRCVPAFLEQWERLSKVIVVAGEGACLSDRAKRLG